MKAVDTKTLPLTLKEAVVDGLLGALNARLAGRGQYGLRLYNSKPRNLITSAFLLPKPIAERERDEESSPIHISTHGLEFQIDASADVEISVRPTASIYVRVYPTKDEIGVGGICEPLFHIRRELKAQMTIRRRELLRVEGEKIGKEYWKHPEWKARVKAINEKVHREAGVPLTAVDAGATVVDSTINGADIYEVSMTDVAGVEVEPETSKVQAQSMQAPVTRGDMPDDKTDGAIPPMKWQRLDLELPILRFRAASFAADAVRATKELNSAITNRLQTWTEDPDLLIGGKPWGYRRARRMYPSDKKSWDQYLAEIRASALKPVVPEISLNWDIQVNHEPVDPKRLSIRVALENLSEPQGGGGQEKEAETAVFQVSLTLTMPSKAHRSLALDRVEPSYRYNEYLHYPALGINGGVKARNVGTNIQLETTWAPKYVLPRLVPTDLTSQGVESRIAELAKSDCLRGVEPLVGAYSAWIESVRTHPVSRGLDPGDSLNINREAEKLRGDVSKWSEELAAISAGIIILKKSYASWSGPGKQSDPRGIPFEAWLSMNEAMSVVAARKGYERWHLFQMAFILANIPGFATRVPGFESDYTPEVARYANASMLLYFSTGGGKSEAFLGLLLFVLFLDRLRGKERGVSAMLRYPLRLLTLQQAQRTVRVLAQAELVRRRRCHPGDVFSLGFWVGSSNTPNWLSDEDLRAMVPRLSEQPLSAEPSLTAVGGAKSYATALERWRKLATCPYCESRAGIALRRFDDREGLLGHFCLDPECKWNAMFGEPQPLPFYIVDEDIYDLAPSVLLGTVDKLAVIGQSQGTIRKFFGMLGFAPWWNSTTDRLHVPLKPTDWENEPGGKYVKLFPSYGDGAKRFYDPFPSLLIQDEAHLLDESLGTFSALFETALDAALEGLGALEGKEVSREPITNRRRQMKVIAASATVQDPERQMKTLYQRPDVVQFPYPGPDIYSSFYVKPLGPSAGPDDAERRAIPDNLVELRSHWARVYESILTNGRSHTVVMVTVLANYHLIISQLVDLLGDNDASKLKRAQELLKEYLSDSELRASFERVLSSASAPELLTLVDLHRISLTYVTNKKGGDQVIDAERAEFEHLHDQAQLPGHILNSELITGAIDAARIGAVVARAQNRPKAGEEFYPLNSALRSIVATSAVSHGVDVEELNSMFFAGMPSDIAEFIQAASRVGRTHVGFCILVPTPQRARDRYIVEVHDIFHRFLERMIHPAAIDRWAEKALVRVVPSFFQTFLCGMQAIQETTAASDSDKPMVPTYSEVRHIRTWKESNPIAAKQLVVKFMKDAYGIKKNFPTMGAEHYADLASHEVETILREVDEPFARGSKLGQFFVIRKSTLRPMTSLRDVDEPGYIVAYNREANGRTPLPEEKLERVMRFIRRGSGAEIDEAIPGDADD